MECSFKYIYYFSSSEGVLVAAVKFLLEFKMYRQNVKLKFLAMLGSLDRTR